MAMKVLVRFVMMVVISGIAVGQAPAPPPTAPRPAAPRPLVAAPVADPVIHEDGSVTFDLLMPYAQVVALELEGKPKPIPMTADAAHAGHWTTTVPPLKPEYYSYAFQVDGQEIVDPRNTTVKPSAFRVMNVFHIPGGMPWDDADVPHGAVTKHEYRSDIVKRNSEYYVYTPPAYDAKKSYPVLYLLHGYSDEGWAWDEMGKANTIFDNLLAAGKMKPMIVVMPLGYGDMDMIKRGWIAWQDRELVARNFRLFGQALYTEVMPRVKAEYPILDGRENHAVAGLSMGGAEALLVGLNHTDDFAWVGGFSSAVSGQGLDAYFPAITAATGARINASMRLLWISCGTEDGLYAPNQALIAWLRERGVMPMAVSTAGYHEWPVWRDNLAHFAPLLFQAK